MIDRYDKTGKLIRSDSSANGGLLQGTLPGTVVSGLNNAANAVTAVYGIK